MHREGHHRLPELTDGPTPSLYSGGDGGPASWWQSPTFHGAPDSWLLAGELGLGPAGSAPRPLFLAQGPGGVM